MTEKKQKKSSASTSNKKKSARASQAKSTSEDSVAGIPANTRFEDALQELEQIVESLESGEHALEESLTRFERGIGLARYCQKSLADAEQKVLLLTGDVDQLDETDEESGLEPFELDGDEA